VTLTRQQLRRFTWLALIAMLGLALAPAVSRALAHRESAAAHPLATAGVATGHADCDEADAASPALHPAAHGQHGSGTGLGHDHLDHCPMCGIAATAWAFAPAAPAWAGHPGGVARSAPARADAVAPAANAWPAHWSRGPPARG